MFSIDDVVRITGGNLYNKSKNVEITSVEIDSRNATKGTLFVALTSGSTDGHNYLDKALKNNAACALISRKIDAENLSDLNLILVENTETALRNLALAYRDRLNIPVIAITGSSGKTSTKDSIAHVLSYKHQVYKTYKNFNNHLGLPLSILQIKPEHTVAVLELGMNHAGEIDLIAQIAKPTISVIINIGEAHIEHLGSREGIADAKAELLPHTQKDGYVLLNQDDDYYSYLKNKTERAVYSYSVKSDADVFASTIQTTDRGTTFLLSKDGTASEMFIPLFGEHNVSNVLAASFIALKFGFQIEELKEALKTIQISEMRFQILDTPTNGVLINDAYNANPASMRASIQTFATIFNNRQKIIVLGDMFELGEEADEIHRSLGEFLNIYPDFTLFTLGGRSRFISEAFKGKSEHFSDEEALAEKLYPYNNKESVVFFKASRGMRLERIVNSLMV